MTMNCKTATKSFSLLFDGRLPGATAERVRTHIDSCETCLGEYRLYEQVFTAVRSVPSLQLDLPTPVPESAGAFTRARHAAQPRRRWAVAASVILLLGAAGAVGFELGRGGTSILPGTDGPETEVTEAGYFPSKPAGQRARRFHDGSTNLAWLAGAFEDVPPSEKAAQAMLRVVRQSPVRNDARELLRLDGHSLGAYESDVHHASRAMLDMVDEISDDLVRRNEPIRTRLRRVRDRIRDSRVPQYFKRLRPVVEQYSPLPYEAPDVFGVHIGELPKDANEFSRAFVHVMTGRQRDATVYLKSLCQHFPESPFARPANVLLAEIMGTTLTAPQLRFDVGTWELPRRSSLFRIHVDGKSKAKIILRESEIRQKMKMKQRSRKAKVKPRPSKSKRTRRVL